MIAPETGNPQIPDLTASLVTERFVLRNRVLVAPMSGVTDVPFRRLAWRFGAGFVTSEMVASEALVTGNAEMQLKAASAGLPLHAVQIAGREPQWMRLAACLAADAGADLIDINMGCPSKRVTNGYSGSALMRNLDNALDLIDAVVEAVDVPVTLKMRLGWDRNSINAPVLARRAEGAGVQLVTVHGRTRNQFYDGEADWAAVQAVRDAISVPLVVNGDIEDVATARDALRLSGADAVMVGRASYGRPWLAGEMAGHGLGETAPGDVIAEHFEDMLGHYGVRAGLRQARKHVGWYFDRFGPADSGLRRELLTAMEPKTVLRLLATAFGATGACERRAA